MSDGNLIDCTVIVLETREDGILLKFIEVDGKPPAIDGDDDPESDDNEPIWVQKVKVDDFKELEDYVGTGKYVETAIDEEVLSSNGLM